MSDQTFTLTAEQVKSLYRIGYMDGVEWQSSRVRDTLFPYHDKLIDLPAGAAALIEEAGKRGGR